MLAQTANETLIFRALLYLLKKEDAHITPESVDLQHLIAKKLYFPNMKKD